MAGYTKMALNNQNINYNCNNNNNNNNTQSELIYWNVW
jgi:hypothetical protein